MNEADQLADWLRLQQARGIGSITGNRLLKLFSYNPSAVLTASPQKLKAHGFSDAVSLALADANNICLQSCLTWQAQQPDHHIVTQNHPHYPTLLKTCPDAPALLFVVGNIEALSYAPRLAFVGSRRCTRSGQNNANLLASQAATIGFCIVSGLAYGIDASAHNAALVAKTYTIAVLANGLDKIYPKAHACLADRIRRQGVLISEYPPTTKPLAQHFPQRNRIISGLAFATVVVEAAARSGSLITAQHALNQGRDVFCVPGSINNPYAVGCHRLIQQGAKLITCIDDILDEFSGWTPGSCPQQVAKRNLSLNQPSKSLLEIIEFDPISVDEIIEKSGLTPEEVCSMLVELEAAGRVICDINGLYSQSTMEGD